MFTRYFSSLVKEGITVPGVQKDLLVLLANNNDSDQNKLLEETKEFMFTCSDKMH
jgi:hypothetical protein